MTQEAPPQAPSDVAPDPSAVARPALTSATFWRHRAVWLVLALVYAFALATVPAVVAPGRFPDLLRLAAPLACLALGQTILIIGRGFDLSVGGLVAIVNVLAAGGLAQRIGGPLTILACLGMGVAVGLFNGAGVVLAGVSPFVMTVGTGFLLSGAALVYTGGAPSGQIPPEVRALSEPGLLGLAPDVYLVAALYLVAAFVLHRTSLGRARFARGMNPEAARLNGIRTNAGDLAAYALAGLLAALGGLFLAGFVGRGTLGAGQDLLLNSLAAAVIGGTTFEGGRGAVSGTIAGALLFTVIGSVLTAAGLGANGIAIAGGGVLLAAASFFRTTSRA